MGHAPDPASLASYPDAASTADAGAVARSAARTGAVVGVALMGSVDEVVFHQLLQWHHFYTDATQFWRVFSDGAFHAFTTTLWFVGALMLWRRRRALSALLTGWPFWSGVFLGAGGFQLFDGTVNHKLLALHPVRLGAEVQWAYDAGWIASGLILLAWGWWFSRGPRTAGAGSR